MDKDNFISRIAPTPSGYLHVGNGVNFLLTWLVTRINGGTLHLRIDDTDTQRVQIKYIDNIFKTLEYLKIDWDKGPQNTTEYLKNYQFKHNIAFYQKQLDLVSQKTSLLYPCVCSRKEIQKISKNGLYSQTCFKKDITYNKNLCSIRLHVPKDTFVAINDKTIRLEDAFGDFNVWRKEGLPSYQFASLVQDETMGVTHIVRGDDLLSSSAAQIYMAKIFNFLNFQKVYFLHHPLIYDTHKQKLSKSKDADSILSFKNPQQIYKEVASMAKLDSGAEDNLESLLEAYKQTPYM